MTSTRAVPYTLYAYTPSPSSHPDLPFLDPASLYAASLLIHAGVTFTIAAPNPWLHSALPRLERNMPSGVVVAEGIAEVEKWAQSKISRANTSETSQPSSSSTSFLSLKALQAHITTHLEPLIYSVFFPLPTQDASGSSSGEHITSLQIFNKVTFQAYSKGLPFPSNRIIPHRLREHVTSSLSGNSSSLHKALVSHSNEPIMSADEKAKEEELERIRSQMKKFDSERSARLIRFGKAKQGFKEDFIRQRTEKIAKETLAPVVTFLKAWQSQKHEENSLPLALQQLFSLIAPLVLYSPDSVMAKHPIAHLMASDQFSVLKDFVHSSSRTLFGSTRDQMNALEASWDKVILGDMSRDRADQGTISDDEEAQEESSSTSARPSSSSPQTSTSWPSYLKSFFVSSKSDKPPVVLSESEIRQRRRLKIGRAVWIGTSIVGSIGWLAYLVMSGAVSIEVGEVEDDDEEEEEEEEEQGGNEDEGEDGEGWIFSRDGDHEHDEETLDMDDIDDVFDDDDGFEDDE
ncbi:unnamed protein product [Sympodiomycopsis kandeliae]